MSQNEKQEYFTVIMAHDWRHACIGKVMHGAAGIRTKISGVYASFSVGRMAAPRSVCLFQLCMRVSVLVETSMQQTSVWYITVPQGMSCADGNSAHPVRHRNPAAMLVWIGCLTHPMSMSIALIR